MCMIENFGNVVLAKSASKPRLSSKGTHSRATFCRVQISLFYTDVVMLHTSM
jgi:hypothetical protein